MLRNVSSKIGSLERRQDYLRKQVSERRGSPGALQFAHAELEAINAAVLALKFHRNTIEAVDEPIGVLKDVVEAYKAPPDSGELRLAIKRAELVLEDFGKHAGA